MIIIPMRHHSYIYGVVCVIAMFVGMNAATFGQERSTPPGPIAGIRSIGGQHINILTDLPDSPEVGELVTVFDMAVPLWCAYFEIAPGRASNWRLTAYVMQSQERFRAADLLPEDLPPILHGFQRDKRIWLYAQPSDYYTRHLLIHEGTHAFMADFLGGIGPPWYAEGLAEMLGTHRRQDQKLTLRVIPASRDEVPYWGRIRIVRDDVANGRSQSIREILHYPSEAFRENRSYAWSWGLATFLDRHPDFQDRFRSLKGSAHLDAPQFLEKFTAEFAQDASRLNEAWRLFTMHVDYGYDVAEERVTYRETHPPPPGTSTLSIHANRGWQSSGLTVRTNETYHIVATGRYIVRRVPEEWPSEPGGITLKYYQGQPWGMLLAAVSNEKESGAETGLLRPFPIGLATTMKATVDGTLFFRINEPAGQLSDNRGTIEIRIRNAVQAPSPIDDRPAVLDN